MIVTCSITHATPASFIAHQPSRQMVEEIAADFGDFALVDGDMTTGRIDGKFSTTDHTGVMIPVFAYARVPKISLVFITTMRSTTK